MIAPQSISEQTFVFTKRAFSRSQQDKYVPAHETARVNQNQQPKTVCRIMLGLWSEWKIT